MPALVDLLARRAGLSLVELKESAMSVGMEVLDAVPKLEKRINIPCCNASSPPGLVEASTIDPWSKSGKYALGWVYFCIILLVATTVKRLYHLWTDKVRTALHKESMEIIAANTATPDSDYEMKSFPSALPTDRSTQKFFPHNGSPPEVAGHESSVSSSRPLNIGMALCRFFFYRPIPVFQIHRLRKKMRPWTFPSLGVIAVVTAALIFVLCYSFVPQPLYWQSIQDGSPPLAIRAGMMAVAMMPWIVGLVMKANIVSYLTGIGHERLSVLHRWMAYICLLLSLIHTVPFYITPVWDEGGMRVFRQYFPGNGVYIYGTGIAALVPLLFLCLHSLPPLRCKFYEFFVMLHVPVSIIFLAMLFWHCKNYLTSWNYLWATTAIWFISYVIRIFYLNWTNPWRVSWLIGEEAAVTIMPESAIKVTIPTQTRWKPGQYVYLRMPGISVFENHPFTIASLCSDDFPSAYGEEYRDMVLVFRPFQGFTRRVLENAIEKGPWHTYRAFIDGPYGGMTRRIDSFDHVVLFAGGSGITALISQLLDLIKRMRDGNAVTKTVQVIWALKRPETMEWFKEELRICRESAPVDSVRCQFYITAAKRQSKTGNLVSAQTPTRAMSTFFHEKVNDAFQGIANNRHSMNSSLHRNSALIAEEAAGDPDREKELRQENEDRIRPLPEAHLLPARSLSPSHRSPSPDSVLAANTLQNSLPPTPHSPATLAEKRLAGRSLNISTTSNTSQPHQTYDIHNSCDEHDFGFPSTPTEFQKNLMRFAFLPAAVKRHSGWSTEYGRPDIPFMLKEMSAEWTGKRICVYVCGPPGMRVDVATAVADLQRSVWSRRESSLTAGRQTDIREEVYLHTENYAL
ncbi:hypothetical protein MBLNU457_3775t1 [Dothideomycetes sp. NU457]